MKLDAWLKRDHSPAERLAVVEGVCGAVVEAHQRGVVRGGLEPSGIEVESDGSCRLDLDPPAPGSAYAAPESAQGGPPTAKAEIYCAGLICYEALGGQPAGSDPLARKPLQDLRPDLSVDLTDAVMACLEADPEWRPADLAYLLALVRGLQQTKSPAAPRTPAKRVSAPPPRAILESATRQRGDDRGPLTRALPLILVAAAMLATGGAWLWFKVLSPTGAAPGAGTPRPRAAAPSPFPSAAPSEPAVSDALPPAAPPSAAPPSDAPRPSAPTSAPAPASSASPRPSPSAGASAPSAAPPAPATVMPPPAPTPTMPAETAGTTASVPNPEPAVQTPGDAGAEAAAVSAPASIRAIAPFRLRPGAMNVLDVHGANLRADHRARLAVSKKREDAPGFTATRYQLRNSELLLVFLQVDAAVRPGKYAFSLVGSDGGETNAFTVEVAGR